MALNVDSKLDTKWHLWIHQSKNDWTIKSYKNLFTIQTIKDFWNLNNSWSNNGGIHQNQYFLMKDNVQPIWEHELNKKGGCWSFKVKEVQAQELWDDLALYLVSGNLSTNNDLINGISITKKKNGWVVLKIWNTSTKESSLKNLNYQIFKKWGIDVIYIAHLAQ